MDIEAIKAKIADKLAAKDKIIADKEVRGSDFTEAERDSLEKILGEIKTEKRNLELAEGLKATEGYEARSVKVGAPVANEAAYSLGEALVDLAKEGRDGIVSKRLQARRMEQRAIVGGNEAVPSQGGFLVEKQMIGGLIENMFESNQLLSRCRRVPVGAGYNGVKFNAVDESSRVDGSRQGGLLAYWTAEGGQKQISQPKFRQIDLSLSKVAVLYPATDELLQDAVALDSLIGDFVNNEIGFAVQEAIMNGNGAGKPLGIMASPCLVTIAKEAGQLAATILYDNLVKMLARVWNPSSRAGKIWIANQDIMPQLMVLTIPVGTGGSVVNAFDPVSNTLLGIPIVFIEQAKTLGTTGDIVLADMSKYYIAEKGGIQAASSIHVYFDTDQTAFRWVYRIDGQPAWHSPLTPANGTNTISPFVALATRA